MKGIVLGLLLALLMVSGCIVKRLNNDHITGTCDGACAHYIECKPGHPEADRARCTQECPEVFSDRDSLMGYESLACHDAVEYVDGTAKKTAVSR
ncbi:hypothetical protein BH11MYX3_BH11MYX3_20730 [soil metagenome]